MRRFISPFLLTVAALLMFTLAMVAPAYAHPMLIVACGFTTLGLGGADYAMSTYLSF